MVARKRVCFYRFSLRLERIQTVQDIENSISASFVLKSDFNEYLCEWLLCPSCFFSYHKHLRLCEHERLIAVGYPDLDSHLAPCPSNRCAEHS